VIGAAATGASGSIGARGRAKTDAGIPCELAALERSNPPALAAPKRNISRLFNANISLPNKQMVIHYRRLSADNQLRHFGIFSA
jgi:hypothetical protein